MALLRLSTLRQRNRNAPDTSGAMTDNTSKTHKRQSQASEKNMIARKKAQPTSRNEPSIKVTTFLPLPRELRQAILSQSFRNVAIGDTDEWRSHVDKMRMAHLTFNWQDACARLLREQGMAIDGWGLDLKFVHLGLLEDVKYVKEKVVNSIGEFVP